jgi:curved DNA-binding protein CbpA
MNPDPFQALSLPARPDLPDEQVRAAWRAIAAATHPDRPDGGDLARYTAASADITGLITWFALTARRDLAPPPER